MLFSLSPFVPLRINVVSRDGFGRPVPGPDGFGTSTLEILLTVYLIDYEHSYVEPN